MDESTSSQPWSEVFQRERAAIREPDGQTLRPDRPLTGLAFSGGGIRSATFNLGILQALSELRLLRHFDYLSCVSGGGYIGGWLSAFIDRQCNGCVEEAELDCVPAATKTLPSASCAATATTSRPRRACCRPTR